MSSSMAITTTTTTTITPHHRHYHATTASTFLKGIETGKPLQSKSICTSFPANKSFKIFAMAPQKKVNKYDPKWKKTWFGAGIFVEGSEEIEVDVFKKLEKGKVLSKVEKAGLLSKAEELGLTLSSIEKLGLFSKAEDLGLLSLLENVASLSPSVLASLALPVFVAAIAAIVVIPDDSVGLVVAQYVLAGTLAVGSVGLLVGSVVLDGLQQAD